MKSLSPNIKGIILMTLAMASLASGDAVIKILSSAYSRPTFLIVAGGGVVVLFATVSVFTGEKLLDRRALSGAPLVRSLAEIGAGSSMVIALSTVPFAILTMVMQGIPLIVTAGAVIFFGEKVGWRRWAAVAVGLIGVFIILRPGAAGFEPAWLFAALAALALAIRDLSSRAVPKDISNLQIAVWGGSAIVLAGIVAQILSGGGLPYVAVEDIPGFAFIILAWSAGVFSVTAAMRLGDVGVIAPFRYMRLPFGLIIGVLVFSEAIDLPMILGSAIIVGSGLYIFFRERNA